jgi:hypothetical protein
MSRFILVVMTLAVTVAGCNRFPDLSIQVTANLAPSDSDCSVADDQEEQLLFGVWDRAVVRDYIITPRIVSFLISHAIEFQGEQQNITIDGFEITILLPDGTAPALPDDLPTQYTVATSAFIEANSPGGGGSQSASLAFAIPSSYQSALAGAAADAGFESIAIDIRANGTTSGGFRQQSPPFRWPIEFCTGCLGFECEEPARLGDALGCFPGQDIWGYCAVIIPAPTPTP